MRISKPADWPANIAPHPHKSKAGAVAITAEIVRGFTFALFVALCASCAATPAATFDRTALALGLEPDTLDGGTHPLRIYTSRNFSWSNENVRMPSLHIYLDGDGRPFVHRTRVARDPTPQDALVLQLLAIDPGPAVYVGRPCYHGLEYACDPRLWTSARYGEAVIASMAEAIATLIERTAPDRVVLFGHSGGGALAVLIGERLATIDAVITVAANLDIDAWSRHHGYTPLAESLNPARTPATRRVPQLHYSGAEDDNVPPVLQAALAQRVPHATFRVIEGFGHTCCWAESWLTRLAEVDAFVTAAMAPPAGG
jgi:hypothetical protein